MYPIWSVSCLLLAKTTNIPWQYWQSIEWNHFRAEENFERNINPSKIHITQRLPELFGHNAAQRTIGRVDCITAHSTMATTKERTRGMHGSIFVRYAAPFGLCLFMERWTIEFMLASSEHNSILIYSFFAFHRRHGGFGRQHKERNKKRGTIKYGSKIQFNSIDWFVRVGIMAMRFPSCSVVRTVAGRQDLFAAMWLGIVVSGCCSGLKLVNSYNMDKNISALAFFPISRHSLSRVFCRSPYSVIHSFMRAGLKARYRHADTHTYRK